MDEKTTFIIEELARLEGLIRRYQGYMFKAYGPLGNPLKGQGRVLAILKLQPNISQKDLSYLLDMRQQSLSELLAKLERSGYITRTPYEEDKRVTMISLTDAGREAAEKMAGEEADMGRVLDVFTPEEREQFIEYLGRLSDALETELNNLREQGGDCGAWDRGQMFTEEARAAAAHIKGHMAAWGFGPMDGQGRGRRGPQGGPRGGYGPGPGHHDPHGHGPENSPAQEPQKPAETETENTEE